MTVLRRQDVQSKVASWDERPYRMVRSPVLAIVCRRSDVSNDRDLHRAKTLKNAARKRKIAMLTIDFVFEGT